jgi:hypothetical protein
MNPLTNQFGNIYERMARSPMVSSTSDITVGEFPRTTFIAQFHHKNGLVTTYDGNKWAVVRQEKELESTV